MGNRPDRRLPRFVGIGPGRTATTWLHEVLEGHVGLPRRTKETDFFSTNYALGLDWYRYHFRDYPASMITGEITPTYFDYPAAPARIAHDLPDCKIVSSLRDPVARIYSHYRLLRSEGWISRKTFAEALAHHDKWADRPGNMFSTSRYALHLTRWFRELGRANVLVTFVDDLERDPQAYLDRITTFIGTPRIELAAGGISRQRINPREHAPRHPHLAARFRRLRDAMERKHLYRTLELIQPLLRAWSGRGDVFPPLDKATDQLLRERFRPDIEALEELLDYDLAHWKTGPAKSQPSAARTGIPVSAASAGSAS